MRSPDDVPPTTRRRYDGVAVLLAALALYVYTAILLPSQHAADPTRLAFSAGTANAAFVCCANPTCYLIVCCPKPCPVWDSPNAGLKKIRQAIDAVTQTITSTIAWVKGEIKAAFMDVFGEAGEISAAWDSLVESWDEMSTAWDGLTALTKPFEKFANLFDRGQRLLTAVTTGQTGGYRQYVQRPALNARYVFGATTRRPPGAASAATTPPLRGADGSIVTTKPSADDNTPVTREQQQTDILAARHRRREFARDLYAIALSTLAKAEESNAPNATKSLWTKLRGFMSSSNSMRQDLKAQNRASAMNLDKWSKIELLLSGYLALKSAPLDADETGYAP